MASKISPADTTLQIKKTIAAPREKVFQAWTDPKALTRWFIPFDDYTTTLAEVDLRVGGKYRIQVKAPDGVVSTVGGVYREVKPPERLVFTWTSEPGGSCGAQGGFETLVTVEFHDRGSSTEIVLTHEGFMDSTERDKHNQGWTGCLNNLPKGF